MHVIYLLVPLSLIFLLGSIWAIRYAIRANQFDDLDGAAHRVILDDREARRHTDQRASATNEPPQP
jgi:cbb3-type cytochrome oxidase maturation protein